MTTYTPTSADLMHDADEAAALLDEDTESIERNEPGARTWAVGDLGRANRLYRALIGAGCYYTDERYRLMRAIRRLEIAVSGDETIDTRGEG